MDGWVIDTILEDDDETVEFEFSPEAAEQLEEAKEKKLSILDNAEAQANQLISEAQEAARQLKETAKAEGYEAGKTQGYEEGLNRGLQEGHAQAMQEAEEIKQEARDMISDAQREIEAYVQEKKESLLSLSLHMAEKIIHEHLHLSPDGVFELVQPILHQLDREEDFVSLTVHSDLRERLHERLPELKQSYPGVRFAILVDETLEENGCIVESAHKVVDLQVKNQLEAILTELKETERDI